MNKLKTAESVSPMHPDKICDRISDAILDACTSEDPRSRVAIETMGGHGIITITGELTTNAYVDMRKIAKKIAGKNYGIQVNVVKQSQEISRGVDTGGAGDQGIMVGYACNDNDKMIPQELYLARSLCKYLYGIKKEDGKTQITLENGEIKTIVASWCNTPKNVLEARILQWLKSNRKLKEVAECEIFANPAGDWNIGGFEADTGLTGRKLAVDNYGPEISIGGGAFCVDGKTEFLTKNGWKRIDEYKKGDYVAQYTDNGNMEFVIPSDYVNENCKKMFEIKNNTNISQALTGNHNFVYLSSRGNLNKKPFTEIKQRHKNSEFGFGGRIIPFFDFICGNGIDLTDDEIRLQIAFMADGTLKSNRIRLVRKRKIKRLYKLLNSAKYDYKTSHNADGYTYFYFKPPIRTKEFEFKNWIKCTKHQFKIIADEVVRWDGNNRNVFRTTSKNNADFIQFVFTITSKRRSSILIDDRIGEKYGNDYTRKSICYSVYRGKTKYCTLKRSDGKKIKIKEISPINDKKYCFTVNSGMLVLRRDNRIFITGNSGKDASKVDRSGAYGARKLAVKILKHTLKNKTISPEDKVEVITKLAYAIGRAMPVMVVADVFINGKQIKIDDGLFFDDEFKPNTIIKDLKLRNPIFEKTAEWGHFGNNFEWDK